jgi:hypothetical protein
MELWCSWSNVVLPKSISLIAGLFRTRTWRMQELKIDMQLKSGGLKNCPEGFR